MFMEGTQTYIFVVKHWDYGIKQSRYRSYLHPNAPCNLGQFTETVSPGVTREAPTNHSSQSCDTMHLNPHRMIGIQSMLAVLLLEVECGKNALH